MRVERGHAGWLSCGLLGLVGAVASCGGFASGTAPEGDASVVPADSVVRPGLPDAAEAGRTEAGAPDGSDASSCRATSAGKLDPTYGGTGRALVPVGQAIAALGPPGTLYVVGTEGCGAGGERGISLRSVPLDGSSAGAILRCFDASNDLDTPISFHGDPSSGYVLASRYHQTSYRARVRFLLPSGADRAPLINAGVGTWPAFAVRPLPGSGPLDVWGFFTASTFTNPFVGIPQGRGAPLQPDEMPVAGATYDRNLVVAFLKQVDDGTTTTLVVRRFVVDASGIGLDASLGKQEVSLPYVQADSVRSQGMIHADSAGIVVAIGQGQSLFPIRIQPGGARPLPPVVGLGSPHVTRRCDGTLAMAYIENGGKVVVTRYKDDLPDPAFRVTVTSGGGLPSFLLRAPDESLLLGIPAGTGTAIHRIVP